MLGSFLDILSSILISRNGDLPTNIEYHSTKKSKSKKNWVMFLPETCYRLAPKKILKRTNLDIYILPKTIIQPNPKLTNKFLNKILNTAIKNQKKNYPKKEVNVLGISIGNVLSFRFAEHFKVNRFLSVVPGSKLAECIWESISTHKIAKNSGKTLKDYQRDLKNYNPIESIPRINPKISEIHLGLRDLMIPYKRGKELAEAMKKKHNTKIHNKKHSGHIETILSFSKQFKKQYI